MGALQDNYSHRFGHLHQRYLIRAGSLVSPLSVLHQGRYVVAQGQTGNQLLHKYLLAFAVGTPINKLSIGIVFDQGHQISELIVGKLELVLER